MSNWLLCLPHTLHMSLDSGMSRGYIIHTLPLNTSPTFPTNTIYNTSTIEQIAILGVAQQLALGFFQSPVHVFECVCLFFFLSLVLDDVLGVHEGEGVLGGGGMGVGVDGQGGVEGRVRGLLGWGRSVSVFAVVFGELEMF